MDNTAHVLFYLTENLPIMFRCDTISLIFAGITLIVWVLCGYYSISYFKGDKKIKGYAVSYLLTLIVLFALDMAGNLVTFYMFYEMMTLCSVLLVIHNRTREAIMAGAGATGWAVVSHACIGSIPPLTENPIIINNTASISIP